MKKWLSKTFAGTSLLIKLTLAFMMTVLIPVIVLSIYTIRQTQQAIRQEFYESNLVIVSQIRENINWKIENIETIGENIVYNSRLQSFLQRPFRDTSDDVVRYKHSLAPIINQTRFFSQNRLHQLGIFYTNTTIPELWSSFFRETRVEHLEWYRNFIDSEQNEIWLSPRPMHEIWTHQSQDSHLVYTYLKKFETIQGQYLGTVVINVLIEDIYDTSAFDKDDEGNIYFAGRDFSWLESAGELDEGIELSQLQANIQHEQGFFEHEAYLYVYQQVPQLDFYIVGKVPLKTLNRSIRSNILRIALIVLTGAGVLVLIAYVIISVILKKMRQVVRVMNHVVKGNFDQRVPVEGSDETGQLAEDFNFLIEEINQLLKRIVRQQTAQKDAQILALQHQINPHFIYNTIDIFRMKMELASEYQTAGAMADFGKIMRYNITDSTLFVTLSDELYYAQKYVNIQKLRFGNRIDFNFRQPDAAGQIKMIKFILQPVIENSIKHGMTNKEKKLSILIDIKLAVDLLTIDVVDDGAGMPEDKLRQINQQLIAHTDQQIQVTHDFSIGLSNINNRLCLFYGDEYHLVIDSIYGQFTRTTIRIPINQPEGQVIL